MSVCAVPGSDLAAIPFFLKQLLANVDQLPRGIVGLLGHGIQLCLQADLLLGQGLHSFFAGAKFSLHRWQTGHRKHVFLSVTFTVCNQVINSLITTNLALPNVVLQRETLARCCMFELTVADISQMLDCSGRC